MTAQTGLSFLAVIMTLKPMKKTISIILAVLLFAAFLNAKEVLKNTGSGGDAGRIVEISSKCSINLYTKCFMVHTWKDEAAFQAQGVGDFASQPIENRMQLTNLVIEDTQTILTIRHNALLQLKLLDIYSSEDWEIVEVVIP